MKVIVKDNYLNVRVGAPRVNAPCYQYLAPGSELEVDGKLYKGDKYGEAGIDTWLKDAAGNYYWSGGVTGDTTFETIGQTDLLTSVSPAVLATKGENITTAIIDGGLKLNSSFLNASKTQIINIDQGPTTSDHGVFIAGIIAGIKDILGIANKTNLVSVKYKSDETDLENLLKNLVRSLDKVAAIQGPLVVNLSQGFPDFALERFASEKQAIIRGIQLLTSTPDRFVICSAGDNSLLTRNVLFPAYLNECIAVGCINAFNKDIQLAATLDIVCPQVQYTSFDLNYGRKKDLGSSFATASIAALVACIISEGRSRGKSFGLAAMKAELKRYATEKKNFNYDSSQTFQYNLL
jgi:hypothetical protein